MAIRGEYLGMTLTVDDLDIENLEYFRYCAEHDFHLQACAQCGRLRYPPTTACPFRSCGQVSLARTAKLALVRLRRSAMGVLVRTVAVSLTASGLG